MLKDVVLVHAVDVVRIEPVTDDRQQCGGATSMLIGSRVELRMVSQCATNFDVFVVVCCES